MQCVGHITNPLRSSTLLIKTRKIAPPIWRTFPQPADCSSNLEDVSAVSGLFLQSGGRFRCQRIVPPIWRTFSQSADCSSNLEEHFHQSNKVKVITKRVCSMTETLTIICRKAFTTKKTSKQVCGGKLQRH